MQIKKEIKLYKIYIRNKTMENELWYKKRLKNILNKRKICFYQNEIDECTRQNTWIY